MTDDWGPDIFEYTDYRMYLGDYYTAAKANTKAFSYRYFSRKAGYSSPNFLKLVIEGKRNVSSDSIDRFAKALKMTSAERRFFRDLVDFCQAETVEEKNKAFDRVAASRRFRKARRLERAFFLYLSRWFYVAIRELAASPEFTTDPKWIAEQLVPNIKPAQAQEALDALLELGLLVQEEDGRISRGETSVTTGHEVRALGVKNYHRQMLQRAAESMKLVKQKHRDVSALTVCISPSAVEEFKERIHGFREGMLDLGDRDENPTAVYQLNIQFFPLSKVAEDEE
jgi:uncharacterized protein (TIGR02147 family)